MRNLLVILSIIVTAVHVSAQSDDHSHTGETLTTIPNLIVQPAGGEIIRVDVNGLVCDFCAQAIDKVFRRNDAVADVAVDLRIKIVEVALKKDEILTDEMLTGLIIDSGYNVVNISRYQLQLPTARSGS